MRQPRRFVVVSLAAVTAGICVLVVAAPRTLAQSGRIVSDAKYTAPYDAFMKMNRLQEAFAKEQSASEYWGVMESRLGNQAGRILIKRPAKDFDDDAFRGWVMFIRAYGDATGIGNCAACHRVPDFTDHLKHNIGTAQGADRDAVAARACMPKNRFSTTAAPKRWRRPSPGT